MTSNQQDPSANKVFNLDDIEDAWLERLTRHKRYSQDKSWLEQFGMLLKQMTKGAKILHYQGKQVASLVDGQLNKTLLAKEQPEIVKKYTTHQVIEVFDEARFAEEEPELHKQYRAQRLVMVNKAKIDPL